MSLVKIQLEVPEEMLEYIDYNDPNYFNKIRTLMMYQLAKEDKISFGKAAEMLGEDKIEFITDLGKMGLPYFDNNIDEVLDDVKSIQDFMEAE